jgi:NFU1 iron-sulfur cluster scaffold homolog, mitochondrial
MFIQTVETPNPETLKFVPGTEILKSGTRTYSIEDNCSDSPIAGSIFKIEGVKGVFIGKNFISVTKAPDQDWEFLKPLALAAIMDHFLSGMPVVHESEVKTTTKGGDDITNQIIDIIETRVRPAVAQDGGDIIFQDFKDGVVYLELQGACSGCPSSTVTLKNGIENMLKHYIPEVTEVRSV